MGEAKRIAEAVVNGAVEMAKNGKAAEVQLKPDQAAVVFAIQRLANAMQVESGQLSQVYNQRDAAAEIGSAMEHLNKYAVRFIAETQRVVVIPKMVMP